MKSKLRTNIMDSVDILDRIDIQVFQPRPGHFSVDFTCKEKGKQIVFDEHALKTLQSCINERVKELKLKASDENTRGYIEEYCGRLIKEYHKADLVLLEDIPEGIDDHYVKFRKLD